MEAIQQMGFSELTPIQEDAVPIMINQLEDENVRYNILKLLKKWEAKEVLQILESHIKED